MWRTQCLLSWNQLGLLRSTVKPNYKPPHQWAPTETQEFSILHTPSSNPEGNLGGNAHLSPVTRKHNFSTSHPFQNTIRHNVARLSQRDLQLKMPGGGCSVTRRQFSSSLLSPQSFCWLQTSEPRYKHLPLVQVNLHSEKARNKAWGSQRLLGTQKQLLSPPPTCRVQAMRLSREPRELNSEGPSGWGWSCFATRNTLTPAYDTVLPTNGYMVLPSIACPARVILKKKKKKALIASHSPHSNNRGSGWT